MSGAARFGTATHPQSGSHLRYNWRKRHKNPVYPAPIKSVLSLDTIGFLSR